MYRVFRKNCGFITIHCKPSLAYIAVRDLQSSQRNTSVKSLLLARHFLNDKKQPSAGERRGRKRQNIPGKTQFCPEHPVLRNGKSMKLGVTD